VEFLIILIPGAVVVEVAYVALYLRDSRLVRLVRARYPAVFVALLGRERRWYDTSDTLLVQPPRIRREFWRLLSPHVATDAELKTAVAGVNEAEVWFRRAAWLAVIYTVLLILALVLRFRMTGGQ
jgi:hypothetical protein